MRVGGSGIAGEKRIGAQKDAGIVLIVEFGYDAIVKR